MGDFRESQVDGLHVVQSGSMTAPAVLLLHGWPLEWSSYRSTMQALGDEFRCIALDLPGIGKSVAAFESGAKSVIAEQLVRLMDQLEVKRFTVVGQDCGAMVAYPLLRTFPERVKAAVLVDSVIPGVPPWEQVLSNPYLWHFAFHSTPELPELLVQDHVPQYLSYFFDTLQGKGGLPEERRQACFAAYADPKALHAGFEWYRAFKDDAKHNQGLASSKCDVPVTYLRGSDGRTKFDDYVAGLKAQGLTQVTGGYVEGAGHFVSDEQPERLAEHIRRAAH